MAFKETYNKFVNIHKLSIDIEEDPQIITSVDYMDTVSGSSPITDIYFLAAIASGEKAALDLLVSGHNAGTGLILQAKYRITNVLQGRTTSEEFYAVDNGDGTYSKKVGDIIYSYNGSKLISKTIKKYDSAEVEIDRVTISYFTDSNQKIIEKLG